MSNTSFESNHKTSVPSWFWVLSVIALLWFLMDISAFFMRVFMTEDVLAAMPLDEQDFYRQFPLWVNIVFAGEVFGGALGSVGLLLRKQWALLLFVVSTLGVLGQTFYLYFLSNAIQIKGDLAIYMPLLSVAIGVGLIVLSVSQKRQGLLS